MFSVEEMFSGNELEGIFMSRNISFFYVVDVGRKTFLIKKEEKVSTERELFEKLYEYLISNGSMRTNGGSNYLQ